MQYFNKNSETYKWAKIGYILDPFYNCAKYMDDAERQTLFKELKEEYLTTAAKVVVGKDKPVVPSRKKTLQDLIRESSGNHLGIYTFCK
jgi:hypothetical protein